MKLINKRQQNHHDQRIETLKAAHAAQLEDVEAQRPQPIEFKENSSGEPLDLGDGLFVMPGDLYSIEGGEQLIVAKPDAGLNGAWEIVED